MFVKIIIFTRIKKIISKNVNGSSGPPYRSDFAAIFGTFSHLTEREGVYYLSMF